MVVLTILGIAALLAVPKLNTAPLRLGAATHEIGSLLFSVQNGAVARQHDMVVAFDQANRRLRLHYDADNDGDFDSGETVRFVDLPDGLEFGRGSASALYIGGSAVTFAYRQAGLPAVVFHRSGSASAEGGFYLQPRVAEAGGTRPYVRAVIIDRGTGHLTWYSYNGGTWATAE